MFANALRAAAGRAAPAAASAAAAARRRLSVMPMAFENVVQLPLLQSEDRDAVRQIWDGHHAEQDDALGLSVEGSALKILHARATACPYFVLPVFRDEGHMMLVTQWSAPHFLLAYLEDYKTSQSSAPAWMAVSAYDNMLEDKDLGLLRGQVSLDHLTKQEADACMALLLQFYIMPDRYREVLTFNQRPAEFDHAAHLDLCKRVLAGEIAGDGAGAGASESPPPEEAK